jgi:hypothetical protein
MTRIESRRGAHRVLVRRPRGKRQLGNVGIDLSMVLKLILKKWDAGHELD